MMIIIKFREQDGSLKIQNVIAGIKKVLEGIDSKAKEISVGQKTIGEKNEKYMIWAGESISES